MIDLKTIDGTLWLAEPTKLQLLAAKVLSFKACPSARQIVKARQRELSEAKQSAARAIRGVKGKVGVVGIHGPVDQRMSSELMKAGGTSIEAASLSFDILLADSQVEAIVLHVDSPGGSSYGIEEFADRIYAARGRKPIYAIADSMACSAAFWLASAAETFCCTPGGDVGSVGVYMAHVDQSAAMKAEGVKVTFIHAAKYKVEGNPAEPLSDEAKTHWQEMVNETYGKFLGALKRNRGQSIEKVRSDYGQGRVVSAANALASGMIDRVMSFDSLIEKLTGQQSGSMSAGRGASAGQVLKLRHEQRKREAALMCGVK